MNESSKNNLPWELIAESLTGSISVDGELQLQQWISCSSENREKYIRIEELWKSGMEDYNLYKQANEEEAWNALNAKMTDNYSGQKETKVIQGQFTRRKYLINIISIAALFIGFVGIGLWFVLPKNRAVIYQTSFNVQKKVSLTDGSVITLQQNTKIEVPASYNKSARTVVMEAGEAAFEVVHNPDKSFIVELGSTQIKDIGTSFTIHKELKSIEVSVSTGKIAFVKLSTLETKELNAGSTITFDVQKEKFGNTMDADSMRSARQLLVFENTPLSEVTANIQKVFVKKIIINGGIANKTFTGQLGNMPFETVIKVICESLGLEYAINENVCIIKEKKN